MANCGNLIHNGIFTSEFNNLATKSLTRWKVPGISIAIIENGTITAKGYGHSNLEMKKPATPETLYHCGSMTKAFTAVAVSLLVDDNENYPHVQWDTPVSKLMPEDFVLADSEHTKKCHGGGYAISQDRVA